MENDIVIAGLGKMGNNYARNCIELKSEFNLQTLVGADIDSDKCRKLKEKYPEMHIYHIDPDAAFTEADDKGIGTSPDMASIIRHHKINGLVGATQTDSHVSVLNDAFSVTDDNGKPLVTRVLQEKPFGLFNEDGDSDFQRCIQTIQGHAIRFGLNSILTHSQIWHEADKLLATRPHLERVATSCVYGKDRTQDERPAHEGVFGTEATHAIEISRGIGEIYMDLGTLQSSHTLNGEIGIFPRYVPYACTAEFGGQDDIPVTIDMSLVFDKQYRNVIHRMRDRKTGIEYDWTFNFDEDKDKNKKDTLVVTETDTAITLHRREVAAGTKLATSLKSVFSDSDDTRLYNLDRTLKLRGILASMRNQTTLSRDIKPKISAPRPQGCKPR